MNDEDSDHDEGDHDPSNIEEGDASIQGGLDNTGLEGGDQSPRTPMPEEIAPPVRWQDTVDAQLRELEHFTFTSEPDPKEEVEKLKKEK